MNRQAKWMMGLAASLLLAAGCNNNASVNTGSTPREVGVPNELVAKARPPVPDVPVPLGFDLDEDESRSLASAGIRWVDHRYTGNPDKWAVGRFYKRQMPLNGWVLDSDQMSQGLITLSFSKGVERCDVRISDGGLFTGTVIRISVRSVGEINAPLDR